MNKNKKIILGTLMLALFGALIVGGDIVTAFDGEGFRRHGFERNDVLETAISSNDYKAFIQELQNIGKREISEITQERFDKIVERYNAKQSIRNALETKDYSAWKSAIEATGRTEILSIINESNFGKFVELHNLRTKIHVLENELGFDNFETEEDFDELGFDNFETEEDFNEEIYEEIF